MSHTVGLGMSAISVVGENVNVWNTRRVEGLGGLASKHFFLVCSTAEKQVVIEENDQLTIRRRGNQILCIRAPAT